MFVPAWDPTWGPEKKIYHLATPSFTNKNIPFWHRPTVLCENFKPIFITKKSLVQCAGTFHSGKYFGSAIFKTNPKSPEDQLIFAVDDEFTSEPTYFHPSRFIKRPNKYFSMAKINGRLRIPFRDPHVMPNGKIAVVTGGRRWGTFGNICEVDIQGSILSITRETILDDSMLNFGEIERPTFIDNLMFFSVMEGRPSILIAELSRSGLYSYAGELRNSTGCYGPSINEDFQLLYWNKPSFTIGTSASPGSNIIKKHGEWTLLRDTLSTPGDFDLNEFKLFINNGSE
jgi:hypothetical protein